MTLADCQGPVVDRVPVVDAAAAVACRRVGGIGQSAAARGALQLKEQNQAEFQTVSHKSKPVQAAEGQIKHLRDELSKARKEKRDAKELAQTYALIIHEVADNLAAVTAERDALASSPQLPPPTRAPTSRTLQRVNQQR
jgi:hypothetical protein